MQDADENYQWGILNGVTASFNMDIRKLASILRYKPSRSGKSLAVKEQNLKGVGMNEV